MLIVEQLKLVLNELDIPVWVSDETMQVTYFNRAWLRLTGRRFEDECNAGWLLRTPSEERERFVNTYVAYFDLGEPFEISLRVKDYRERDCHLLLKGVPLFNTDKSCKGYVTFCYDQTEKFKVEEQLLESELFYRTLFEKSPIGIVVISTDGSVRDFNDEFALNCFKQEKTLLSEMNVLKDEQMISSGVSSQIQTCIDLRQTVFFEAIHDFDYSGKKCFSYRLTPLLIKNSCEGVIAFVEDTTERKALDEQVLQSHKLATLGNLAAGIAHELNSPLGVMKISCDLLKMGLEEAGVAQDVYDLCVKNMIKSTENMSNIVKQVMNYARGNSALQKLPLDLNALIDDAFLMFGKIIRIEDIQIVKELSPVIPTFLGSSNHIQTVITDLINFSRENLKSETDNKVLRFKTSFLEELNCISLEVYNNGMPLASNIVDRIFNPFFTINSHELGPGLGLSISRQIILDHGGSIGFESDVKKGNRFTVLFPLTESED